MRYLIGRGFGARRALLVAYILFIHSLAIYFVISQYLFNIVIYSVVLIPFYLLIKNVYTFRIISGIYLYLVTSVRNSSLHLV